MDVEGRVRGWLSAAAQRCDVPGATVAWCRGEDGGQAQFGVADIRDASPVLPQTRFPVGSVTKAVTGTVVLRLVCAGRLGLDDAVGRLLPELAGMPSPVGAVTVRQLLSHTSPLPGDVFQVAEPGATLGEYVRCLAAMDLEPRPPGQFSYCNSGFVLLGRVVEAVTGQSWTSVVTELLSEIGSGGWHIGDRDDGVPVAVGHERAADGWGVSAAMPAVLGPAGSTLAMSAQELLAFGQLHLRDGATKDAAVLPASMAELMRTPQVHACGQGSAFTSMGLSWELFEWGPRTLFGHGGRLPGHTALMVLHRPTRCGVTLLTNGDGGVRMRPLVWDVLDLLVPGGVRPPTIAPADRASVTACDVTGEYTSYGTSVEVTATGSALVGWRASADGTSWVQPVTLVPSASRRCCGRCIPFVEVGGADEPSGWAFIRDTVGKVSGLLVGGRFLTRVSV